MQLWQYCVINNYNYALHVSDALVEHNYSC